MSGDFSRLSFDPKRHYAAVELQQGRPLTDADWNEQAALTERRVRVGMLDTVGRAVVPRTTPEGFRITLDGGQLAIGRGRMYVDGLLVENHGSSAAQRAPGRGTAAPLRTLSRVPFLRAGSDTWDGALAERHGAAPTPFASQPFVPVAAEMPRTGSWVAYLDVWQREVSHLQDPELMEKALGVDTTTRRQTVWQVKLHEVARASAAAGATCANALDNDAAWAALVAAPSSRLTTATATVPGEPDPCLLPPGAGYRGLENQLYRIEIHRGGTAGNATFKWSRDNASVETRVARIVDATHVIVDSIGKDGVLRFSDGDWVEFLDEARELSGQPGELRRIRVGNGVDDATRQLTLDQALPAADFAPGVPDAARALRVRRWDQKGRVRRVDGTIHADLDASGSSGAIPVPAAGAALLLENGVTVSFSLQAGGSGRFRSGEWWVFAARAADASIEELNAAPPRGPHHHYAKLAVLSLPDGLEDCRVPWPPEPQQGEGCACTVCVSPASHADGSMTLQQAIAEVQRRGGGTVCLDVGQYRLAQPLQIERARSLRLRGQGSATVLVAPVEALQIRNADDVVLEDLTLRAVDETPAPAPSTEGAPISTGPATRRPAGLRTSGEVQRLNSVSTRTSSANLSLRRVTLEDRLRPGEVSGGAAAPAAAAEPEALVLIEDARDVVLRGVWLEVRNAGDIRDEAAGTTIEGIALLVRGAAPGLRIEHCRVAAPLGLAALAAAGAGTVPPPGTRSTMVRAIQESSCLLRANRFDCGFAALMVTSDTLATHLCVEDNVLECERYGLIFAGVRNARIEVRANALRTGVGVLATDAAMLTIHDNLLRGAAGGGLSGGILMMGNARGGRWGMVDVRNNLIGGIRGIAVGVAGTATGMSLRLSGNRLSNVGRGLVFADYAASVPGRGSAEEDGQEPARSIRVEDNEITLAVRQAERPTGDDLPEPDALALSAEQVRVSGNSVEGGSTGSLIGIDAGSHCELSANRCENSVRGTLPDVHVRCGGRTGTGTIAASSNRLVGVRSLALALETLPVGEQPRCTVLGNIARGDIRVFGSALPAPLNLFNVIGA